MDDVPAKMHSTGMRIEVAVGNTSDHQLLKRTLGAEGYVTVAFNAEGADGRNADLLIVDPPSLDRLRQRIGQLQVEHSPVVFPVLLLVKSGLVSPTQISRELGTTATDVLSIPTTVAELCARVRNLLRLRQLSLQQFHEYNLSREIALQETTELGLIKKVCKIITQFKGHALACVGIVDEAHPLPQIQAFCSTSELDESLTSSLSNEASIWQGLAGWAMDSAEVQLVDVAQSSGLAPWRAQLQDRGLGSLISLPLCPRHGSVGVLLVGASRPGAFGPDERQVLERLSTHLTFGLDKLRMQSERSRQEAAIQKLAFRDPLTDLPNRRYLLHRLEQMLASDDEQKAAVLFVDLNNFKLVNDALGHAAGDEVLKRVARRIQNILRDGDLVARQGGDEFIIVLVDDPREPTDAEEGARRLAAGAEALAGRIIKALEHPFTIQGHSHHLSASIGISLLPYFDTEPEIVIAQADMAMYQAKKSGYPLVCYSPGMEQHRLHRLTMEAKLYRALEYDEFQLHYQPIWDIATGGLVGVEALLRWTDAEGNRVSPGEFIPVVEDLRLMGPLGDWVLKTAARQLVAWRAQGLTLAMAVNLSVSQLQGRSSAEHIYQLLLAEGTQPDWWHLELTEESLMHEPEEVEEAMNTLSDFGFHLALDDFGRGYSSLARLQMMPLDVLKIDKLFIDRLIADARGEPIVRAILDLARHLSIKVVAEGIETTEQRDRLAALGCQLGQGYLVSAARPAGEIEMMLCERGLPCQ